MFFSIQILWSFLNVIIFHNKEEWVAVSTPYLYVICSASHDQMSMAFPHNYMDM